MFLHMRKRLGRLLLSLLLVFVGYGFMSCYALFEQTLIDSVAGGDMDAFLRNAVVALGYLLISACFVITSDRTVANYTALIMSDMRNQAFSGLLRQELSQTTKVNSADTLSTLTNDIATIKNRYFDMFFLAFTSCIGILASIVIMFLYQPIVAAIAVASGVAMLVVPLLTGRIMAVHESNRSESFSSFTTVIKEMLSGFDVILSFGIQKIFARKFEQVNKNLLRKEEKVGTFTAITDGMAQALSAVSSFLVLAVSCYMVMRGEMTIGALVAIISLKTTFASCLTMLMQAIPLLKGTEPIIARVNDLANIPASPPGKDMPPLLRKIELKALGFAYEADKYVLEDVNLTINKGDKIAIIGENGSGKTTLIRLLVGIYRDYKGSILYDDMELSEIDSACLRRMVSVVSQNVFLFDDSIISNITLGEDFPQPTLERALAVSGVSDFARSFEEGLNHSVGENGGFLSGGQRQRIAIARALIRDARVLILDEGTSALDEETAKGVEMALLSIPDLTVIVITHNMSPEHLAPFHAVHSLTDEKNAHRKKVK